MKVGNAINKKITLSRIIIYLIGLNVLSIGTVLFKSGRLGVSSLVSVPQIVSLIFSITLGKATSLFFVLLIVIELILTRKIKLQILLQLLLAYVFGKLVDFYGINVGIENVQLSSLWLKALVTLAAIVFTSLGIFTMVKADIILIPPDGLVHTISDLVNSKFGKIKFFFDLSMIVISLILSFTFLGHLAAIGVGTIAAVILVGQLINVWDKTLRLFELKDRS